MRKLSRGLAFLSLAPILLAAITQASETFSGKCVGVSDGDTINVLRGGRETRIRLEGIDRPESGRLVRACEHLPLTREPSGGL